MRKYSIIATFMLCCSVALFSAQSFAAPTKEEADVENIKAPPRDVKDILLVLSQARADKSIIEKATKILALPVPTTSDTEVLNHYYYRRAAAEDALENTRGALENIKKAAVDFPSVKVDLRIDEMFQYAGYESAQGHLIAAKKISEQGLSTVPQNLRGWALSFNRQIVSYCLGLGDFECAKSGLAALENDYSAIISIARNPNYLHRMNWENTLESTRGRYFLAEGKFIEAERSIRRSLYLNLQILDGIKDRGRDALDNEVRISQDSTTAARNFYAQRAYLMADMAKAYLGQRRLVDAEYWSREATMLAINQFGPNSGKTAQMLLTLTRVVAEQGRNAEAVLLGNAALKVAQQSTSYPASTSIAYARKTLATSLVADGKYTQAEKVFAEMVENVKADPDIAARFPAQDLDWALALVKTGKAAQAATMTGEMLAKNGPRMEKGSTRLAMLTAFNASALQASGRSSQALSEFKISVPILIDQSRNDAENNTQSIRQTQRMTFVLEEYLASLAQQAKTDSSGAAAAEAFQVADLARGSGVQRALTSSAARANISDPQLAGLARREQDLQQRINTLTELLTGLLSAPPAQQLPAAQAKIRTDITAFKSQRDDLKKEIEKKFPDYAELVEPKPASVERTQKALKPDEVLISWYFGDNVGYVWAITKDKPAQFAQLSIGRAKMAKDVAQLRKALDPGVATIDEIPAFDVVLANQLYQQVLAPVQSAFAGKKVMLTVPHAELGQLPLSLLVTKPTAQPAKGGATPFIGYKTVPWLTRDIAVAQVPSVTALTALRSLPAGNPNRKNFIGFGDPYFSAQQEQQADKQAKSTQLATRGIPLSLRSAPKTSGVSSAELALLPRLPDTSLELEEIGKAIGAGDGDIFLHKQASVKQVMATDLSNRKVVMFATHGLVPGELNGLTQPALALSSPDVTGDKDDGLLTMDKVLTLKLDADWVVLSACNTAAGEGAGSEAVSGLGRAFFFAGAKALLVSNWPVDSVASRTLMTDLFKNQQKAQGTSKAELLRQAMLTQIDQGGMKEGANMKYAYAHPLFWAPFVVVGD
ncbi:CHAT domain-containing tetratricopeptide repeat protein [Polynucleobacter sp. UB-Piko-W3]|uniref:CHAT domain-containing protein n=1 Tax=Polynucleobacter sp. UB-Piko-W3 TaxID=1819735 RepID=UPI001C0C5F8B|nr:CHAT domain-containing tetratricopeptide repeat protein [Polynucleobacter sp. UB-Piko-W3]MBU3555222.1 CHAT domain-containing protein [Polynucleobacter sp. UB-Piko-W3]